MSGQVRDPRRGTAHANTTQMSIIAEAVIRNSRNARKGTKTRQHITAARALHARDVSATFGVERLGRRSAQFPLSP